MIAAIMRLSLFSSKQCIIKQLLDSVFVISGIIKVAVSVISLSLEVSVISRSRRVRLITLTETLIIPDIIKTSSNNCFNHKNYNFLDCDWFKKLLFSTNSLAKLLSDSLLLDSLLLDSLLSDSSKSQSHSKM